MSWFLKNVQYLPLIAAAFWLAKELATPCNAVSPWPHKSEKSFGLGCVHQGRMQDYFGEVRPCGLQKKWGEGFIPSKTHHFWPTCKQHYGNFGKFSWFCYFFPFFFLDFLQISFFGECNTPLLIPLHTCLDVFKDKLKCVSILKIFWIFLKSLQIIKINIS